MIVTDKFVFVHLPRSGGTFVSELIRKCFPSAKEIGYHLPRTLLPKEYCHLPVLGAVRNPWDFYVSWYYHVWPRDAETTLVSWATDNGKAGFAGTTMNVLNLGTNNQRLDALLERLPADVDYRGKHIPNITQNSVRKIRGSGVGYYTFRFNHLFGDPDDMFICRFERLREDLIAFFAGIGAVTPELRDYVFNTEPKNTADHRHYSTYYTPELANLVSVRDRELIDRYGYVFEAECAAQGLEC
jgi:hypothetical protein